MPIFVHFVATMIAALILHILMENLQKTPSLNWVIAIIPFHFNPFLVDSGPVLLSR